MIKYRIITDSSSGISPDEADKLGITVLPLNLEYKGEMYRDGIDISTDEFYAKLFASDEQKKFMLARFMEKKEMPKSTLVSPALFEEEFQKCKDNNEIALVLPIAACLSGTLNSARIASEMVEGLDSIIVDSKTALGAVKIIIYSLLKRQYDSKEELEYYLNFLIDHVEFLAVPDTLEYLFRLGRLSKTTALLGNLFQIKPLIELNSEGKLVPIEKIRGLKQSFLKLKNHIEKNAPIDPTLPCELGYSNHIENVNQLEEYLKDILPNGYTKAQISPVVGAHVGPGASAFFYFTTKTKKDRFGE